MLHLLLNKQLVTLDSIIIPCVRVCVCVPHLGAVEHPDLVQSLLGCHGASERLPQAVESTEVTSLSASCSPPPTSDAQHHDSPARCNTPSDAIQRWMADVPRQKRKKNCPENYSMAEDKPCSSQGGLGAAGPVYFHLTGSSRGFSPAAFAL